MLRTCNWLIRVLAVALILFSKTALTAAFTPGDLDPTYGTGGKVTTDFQGGAFDLIGDAVVQPDGKLVAICQGQGTDQIVRWGLVRYRLDGSLDPTFGNNGKVVISSPILTLNGVALQSDGKIVVAGANFNPTRDFVAIRFNKDGSLDTAFGSGGFAPADFFQTTDQANDLAIQADGKIVLVGSSDDGLLAVARFNTDGSLDTSFGNGGKSAPGLAPGLEQGLAVAIQPDGKIVAAGSVVTEQHNDFLLTRFETNGALDTTFGDSRKVITDFGNSFDDIHDIVLQPDGQIVAAGTAGNKFALARYNTNGSLDNTFGAGGKVTTTFLGVDDAQSVVLQRDGKIVMAGSTSAPGGPIQRSFALARYNINGSLDSVFGDQGKVTTSFAQDAFSTAVVLQPDDKIVVAGANNADLALVRYLTAPVDAPVLQTEAGTNHAIAIESVTFRRDPFFVTNDLNFSSDRRTRIILFATNLTLGNSENFSAVAVQAEDAAGMHNLPVEFVGAVPGAEWLTQVVVKLPDDLATGNVLVSVSFHSTTSNKPFIVIQ